MSKLAMKLIGALLLSVSTCFVSNAQNVASPDSIIVKGEITGDGEFPLRDDLHIKGLFIKLTVLNSSTTIRNMRVMSCSWQDNWQTSNQNLRLWYAGCDKNVEERIRLNPGKSIVFYGFLTLEKQGSTYPNGIAHVSPRPSYDKWSTPPLSVRFGFTEIRRDFFDRSPRSDTDKKVWWSTPVSLQFDNNSFVVED